MINAGQANAATVGHLSMPIVNFLFILSSKLCSLLNHYPVVTVKFCTDDIHSNFVQGDAGYQDVIECSSSLAKVCGGRQTRESHGYSCMGWIFFIKFNMNFCTAVASFETRGSAD